jgi:hypothetical protein
MISAYARIRPWNPHRSYLQSRRRRSQSRYLVRASVLRPTLSAWARLSYLRAPLPYRCFSPNRRDLHSKRCQRQLRHRLLPTRRAGPRSPWIPRPSIALVVTSHTMARLLALTRTSFACNHPPTSPRQLRSLSPGYFARVTNLNGYFLTGAGHVFTLQTDGSVALKRAKPEAYASYTSDDLLYWQNLKTTGKASAAILSYESKAQ